MANKKVITGNFFNKYESNNPLVKFVMGKYFGAIRHFLDGIKFDSMIDLGCGEGEIIRWTWKNYGKKKTMAYDIDNILLANIKSEFPDVKTDTIYLDKETDTKNSYDLALFLEVLEHIEDYEAVLKNISKMKFKYLLISVPNEPFFRGANIVRLKYVMRLGNTPGHVNNFHYFKFRSLVNKYFPKDKVDFRICWIWNFAFIRRKK
jgi:2-polyprenyl-3-methyl-5-hydroxy-6-metoxy-1,4-benzoquinol methylase